MAQAFTKGCYFGAHTDLVTLQHDEVKIVVVWHATEHWDPSWGGLLRFFNKDESVRPEERNPDTRRGYEEGEIWVPRFNELHVLTAEQDGVHEVTMVTTEEAVRYTLAARLLEPAEAMAGV
jgi:Rps23 Pro-64 3,4-dihydroxylase Tpa1-like proline 4-hydroxylase